MRKPTLLLLPLAALALLFQLLQFVPAVDLPDGAYSFARGFATGIILVFVFVWITQRFTDAD